MRVTAIGQDAAAEQRALGAEMTLSPSKKLGEFMHQDLPTEARLLDTLLQAVRVARKSVRCPAARLSPQNWASAAIEGHYVRRRLKTSYGRRDAFEATQLLIHVLEPTTVIRKRGYSETAGGWTESADDLASVGEASTERRRRRCE